MNRLLAPALGAIAVLALADVAHAASPRSGRGATPPPDPVGAQDQACRPDGTCNASLVCVEGLCRAVTGPPGAAGGLCYSDRKCDRRLVCLHGLCVVPQEGMSRGACRPDHTCDEGLTCFEFVCLDDVDLATLRRVEREKAAQAERERQRRLEEEARERAREQARLEEHRRLEGERLAREREEAQEAERREREAEHARRDCVRQCDRRCMEVVARRLECITDYSPCRPLMARDASAYVRCSNEAQARSRECSRANEQRVEACRREQSLCERSCQ